MEIDCCIKLTHEYKTIYKVYLFDSLIHFYIDHLPPYFVYFRKHSYYSGGLKI